jgi:ParB family chromosome partitioning protein
LALSGAQQLEVAKKIAQDSLTVRAAERLIKDLQNPKAPKVKTLDHDTLRLQNDLTAKLGAKVVIEHKNNGTGKLLISYNSLEELDGIIEQIK